jgi:hypothetical protein
LDLRAFFVFDLARVYFEARHPNVRTAMHASQRPKSHSAAKVAAEKFISFIFN